MLHIKLNGNPDDLFKKDLAAFARDVDVELATSAKMIESSAKRHIRTLQVFNTGGLFQSINAKKTGRLRHVVGTPKEYAQLNEEGARMTKAELDRKIAAMGGKPPEQSKGVLKFVGGNTVIWKARPYLKPALKEESAHLVKRLKRLMP